MRRKGYPLWQPKPDDGVPLAYLREGVQIGDLGILNEFGGFDYIFNVCRPADDPINDGRVPEDFKPITGLKDQDTRKREDEYWPGTHVASRDVDIQRGFLPLSPSPLPNAPVEIGGGLSFGSRSSRGALLVLPEGATRRDHLNLSAFHSYATQYAKSWYAYINGPLGRQATNGSLYLVTGCDKARAWGVASFSGARPGDVLLEFVPVPSRVPDSTHPDYYFRLTNSASASSGSDCRFGNQSGCVFLRGFKIAIRTPKFTSLQLGVVVSSIMDLDSGNLVPNRKRAAIVLSSSRFLKFSLGKKKVVGSGIQESTPLGSSVDIQVFPSRHPVCTMF
ncbi:hypothetical protein BT96DRAFT_840509 [Gymnopus androsaceus JB14]|uniref:Uncharacterized protein n=1 Tax=Gymnopus androsaceus JB14 TaxID=1447944 RepID=A0A6A4GK07_9AGAR|nr:hypothetical protein BT96DRAFT_840509 [Gymnopus androsaceus JB14]